MISNRDVPVRGQSFAEHGVYGTYFVGKEGVLTPLASPVWVWGNFYEKVVRDLLDGTWEQGKGSHKALSYWWGMDSGVIDVKLSDLMPPGVEALAQLLRRQLQEGTLDPFCRKIVAQDGTVKNDGSRGFTAEELLHMDWLCENVEGSIPEFDEIEPFSQPMVRELGLHRDRIPLETEGSL